MRGVVQNIYHNSYTLSFLVLVFILFRLARSMDISTLSSSESLTISSNRTLVSPGGVFELGFFKPSARSRWYLGIWYKKVTEKTYAWVANRDNPLLTSTGTLEISRNNLVLIGQSNKTVWSTSLPIGDAPVIAELLSNGNFVLRHSDPSKLLWQSFDFPTDTLLPEMKLGYDLKTRRNRFLTEWRAQDDPTSGNFTFKLDIQRGLPEFLIMYQDLILQRSGPWDGIEFSGIPEMQRSDYMVYNYTENSEEVSYRFRMTSSSIYSRLIMRDQILMRFTWSPPSWAWERSLHFILQGICDLNNTKLPDTKTATVDRGIIDGKKCKERCLSDCNCTSFAFGKNGLGCVTWTGDLVDIRTYFEGGLVLYIKVPAADDLDFSSGEKRDGIIGWSIGGVSLMLILIVIVFCFWKRRQKQAKADAAATIIVGNQVLMNEVVLPRRKINLSGEDQIEDLELPLMEFDVVLAATEHFSDSNKVGKCGFGVVYKVWKQWNENQRLEILDTAVDSSSPTFRPREILRCLQIGLLCVQEHVEDRPMMSSVVLMLGSEAVFIPQPKRPGYCVASGSSLDTRSEDEACTVNKFTMSIIDAR
ncbi:hypothetical protein DY000_02035688 [Brassica cretica]|uniref:Uncharacterized protein n=1 Tax=Brassica cretica TaxID=69181 RepID=A0ABQ7DGK7_BRACR|nr:hypothetical protein DY000_02035688 [Brassica cretica]